MELKPFGKLQHDEGQELLIVPYGIETAAGQYQEYYLLSFNRTLWN